MKEEKTIRIRLGTVICLVVILLLLIGMFFMYYYGTANKNREISNLEREKIAIQKENVEKTDNSIIKTEIKAAENTEVNSDKIENTKNAKEVNLNGKKHTVDFICNINGNEELKSETVTIMYDGQKIKTFMTSVYNEEIPQVYTITGDDNKTQNLLIKISTYTNTSKEEYFCFVNEKGEILGIISWEDATSIEYNGKVLTYEINNNNLIYYVPTYLDRSNKNGCAVIKYEITCGENELNSNILETYTYEEVTMAGAWR